MTDQEHSQILLESRQRDINAMLMAILLIERGQPKEAAQVLIERLPEYLSGPLKARADG